MKYTVIWKPSAEARLAQIWTEAHDRNAVALAANALDRLLQFDAESEGESRTGNIRITWVQPLAIHFRVEQEDGMVYVLKVWHTGEMHSGA
jgi:plasmid stabilization system protein ParE